MNRYPPEQCSKAVVRLCETLRDRKLRLGKDGMWGFSTNEEHTPEECGFKCLRHVVDLMPKNRIDCNPDAKMVALIRSITDSPEEREALWRLWEKKKGEIENE